MNLKCINVRDDIINKILYDYEARVIKIPTLENKSYYDDCIKNCNNTTCEPAIDACISSCCGSNEKCRTSVHEMKNK